MEIIKNIAAIVGCISASIGLVVAVVKPVRKVIVAGITAKQKENEAAKKLNQVIQDVGDIKKEVGQFQIDIKSDIDKIQSNIAALKNAQKAQEAIITKDEIDRIRWEILSFANGCRYDRKHTRNEFEHIISLSGKYEKLLEKIGEVNGVFEAEYNYILELYNTCLREGTFLA